MQIHASSLNQYHQYSDGSGQFVWQSTSAFVPVQSQSFGNITIGHIMSIEFDFVWNGHVLDASGSAMFFRIGADALIGGNGCFGNWNRYPALFITDNESPSLLLYLSEEGRCSKKYDLSSFGVISRDTEYHVQITFNMTTLYVAIAPKGLIPRSKTWSRQRTPIEFVGSVAPIWWISGKYGSSDYVPADATFSNVFIQSTLLSASQPDQSTTDVLIPWTNDTVIEPTRTIEPVGGVGGVHLDELDDGDRNTADTFVVEHDPTQSAPTEDHSTFIALSILTASLCFVSGCCLSWITALHLQRMQSVSMESHFADAASSRGTSPSAPSPRSFATSPATDSSAQSGTVQIFIKSQNDVMAMEDEEKEGIIEREETPSGSSLYGRKFSMSSFQRRSPQPGHPVTGGQLKLDVNVLRALRENVQLPVTVIKERTASPGRAEITPSPCTEMTTPALYRRDTTTERVETPPYYMH